MKKRKTKTQRRKATQPDKLGGMRETFYKLLSKAQTMALAQAIREHKGASIGDAISLTNSINSELGKLRLMPALDIANLPIGQLLGGGPENDWMSLVSTPQIRAIASTSAKTEPLELDKKVLNLLKEAQGWVRNKDIRNQLGIDNGRARRSLKRLVARGDAENTGMRINSRYRIKA